MSISPCDQDEVTAEEIAAVEKVLQHIDRQNFKRSVLGPLANWMLALRLYKELELRYLCMENRGRIEQRHRALLSAIMGMGECILAATEEFSDADLKCLGLTKDAVDANVVYLRAKYAQWYGKRDRKRVEEALKKIENAEC